MITRFESFDIASIDSMVDHPRVMPEPMSGCWIWCGKRTNGGHGRISIGRKNYGAHRVSWEKEKGKIPDGMQVLHKCHVASCVNPDHLYLGTHEDNMRDKKESGRSAKTWPKYKLNRDDVSVIRIMRGYGSSATDLAKAFGVIPDTIHNIISGRTWKEATHD